jgi:hypothetical protein
MFSNLKNRMNISLFFFFEIKNEYKSRKVSFKISNVWSSHYFLKDNYIRKINSYPTNLSNTLIKEHIQ